MSDDKIAQLSGKAPSQVGSVAASYRSGTSNPRILLGDDRTKFVTTVLDSTFFPEKTD